MVRCVRVGWGGVRPGVIRRGRYGELSWVQLGIIKVHHEEMRGDVVTEQDVEHER